MKLVVVDVSSVSSEPEREFVLPIVKVGRDSALCQIVFDRVTWPMVSRYHSEFRLEAGKCVVFDANSTFGTFVNGERVREKAEVHNGALIQFGVGGPT
ncbi:MAG TPA: FHA domain-containing protein, partial [Pyrinomonadaceae bacterium]|nr:FHA domain-containing protein [Pyrinomonadaceae bacterium]